MIKRQYALKHKDNNGDYKAAYDIAGSIELGSSITYEPSSIKVFRKYLYEVGAKLNRSFASRKNGSSVTITLLSESTNI